MFATQQILIIMENNKPKLSPREPMTHLDRMLKELTLSIARRMHKHISVAPDAIDDGDIIVEREGWLTIEEIMAATYINAREIGAEPYECFTEAAKRNVV